MQIQGQSQGDPRTQKPPGEPVYQVRFEYCISFVFLTLYRESEVITVNPRHRLIWASLPYNLITFFLGWWGVPWGLLLTPRILIRNLTGGIAVLTNEAN